MPGTPVNDVKNTDIPSKKKNTEPAGGVTFFLNSRIEPKCQMSATANSEEKNSVTHPVQLVQQFQVIS